MDCGGPHCPACPATKPVLPQSAVVAIGVVGGSALLAVALTVYIIMFTWVGIRFGLRKPRPGEHDGRRDDSTCSRSLFATAVVVICLLLASAHRTVFRLTCALLRLVPFLVHCEWLLQALPSENVRIHAHATILSSGRHMSP